MIVNNHTIIITTTIIKRISRAPVYCTRWEHRVLYDNTNNKHTHTYTHNSESIFFKDTK